MDTGEVKIVTDSTSYLEPDLIKRYGIEVVPIRVAFGTKVFEEGINITNRDFYKRLAAGGAFPTTSQPAVGDFVKVYQRLSGQGHPVLSIHISSSMSGTVNSAQAAKETLPDSQIEIIDSRTLAMGLLVLPAAEAARRGQPLPELKASIERLNSAINSVGLFETLKYAWKGGRIGAARALIGTLLQIKPVLTYDSSEVKILAKPRTLSGAIDHIVEFIGRRAGGPLHGWLAQANALPAAETLEKELRANFKWAELRLFELGPVFATHMGPGFIGLGFYSESDWQP